MTYEVFKYRVIERLDEKLPIYKYIGDGDKLVEV